MLKQGVGRLKGGCGWRENVLAREYRKLGISFFYQKRGDPLDPLHPSSLNLPLINYQFK